MANKRGRTAKAKSADAKKVKVEENGHNAAAEAEEIKVEAQQPEVASIPKCLNFNNGQELFQSFLGDDLKVDDFIQNYWEKKPLHIKRDTNEEWLGYLKQLFSLGRLKEILTDNKLLYGIDINLCKLVDEKKKVFNKKGNAKPEYVSGQFEKERVTIQFHQPQRFSDELWRLLEKLECYFDCLVGSNVYITPAGSQGLAPHNDDIEAFVVQLEGSKRWLLYEPQTELPNTYSNDLSVNDLKEPTHDIVLNAGDILYFPRGIIHQANTPENDSNMHSTHITISTYQDFNRMEYIGSVLNDALENSFKNNLELRRGVPIGFFRNDFSSLIKSTLEKIELDNGACYPVEMLKDFMRNRLPPFGITDIPDANHDLDFAQLERLKNPDESLKIKLKYPEHMNVVLEVEEVEEDDDEEEAKQNANTDTRYTFVYHSVFNLRDFHMMQEQENDNCVKLNENCYEIVKALVDNSKNDGEWFNTTRIEELISKKVDQSAFGEVLVSLATENLIDICKE